MFRKLIFFSLFGCVGWFFVGNLVTGKAVTQLVNMSSHLTGPSFEMKLANTKINLFGGTLELDKFGIRNSGEENSAFYRLKRLFVDIDIRQILDRKLVIEQIQAADVNLLFIRHEPGQSQSAPDFSAQPSAPAPQEAQPGKNTNQPQSQDTIEEKEKPAKTSGIDYSKIIGILLKKLEGSAIIEFEDKTVEPNFRQGINVRLKAKDLSTYPVPGTAAGTILIKGGLKTNSKLFLINAKATVPPLTNPHRPDFELEATIRHVDVNIFAPYLQDSGLTDGTMEIEAKIVCRNGEYDRLASVIKTSITKIKFSEEALSRMPKEVKIPKQLEFTSHIYGTFDEPKTDFAASLAGVIINKVFRTSLAELLTKQMNK